MSKNLFANRKGLAAMMLAGSMMAGVVAVQPAMAGDGSVAKAAEALQENELGKAVRYAEDAVESEPRDAARRALLGRTYLRAGRIYSARSALAEAVSLGDNSPRTALMLALAEIGAGNPRAGVSALAMQGNAIPAADRGLAFALAGETARGVEIISADIRIGNNTPKNRQNLAYAFALDGRWREARLMAAQDVPANMLDQRITEWATTSRPDQVGQRVAALVGTELADDQGMPRALALSNFPAPAPAAKPAAPVQMAKAEPVAPAQTASVKPAVVAAPEKPAAKPVVVAALAEPAPVKTAAVPASNAAPQTMQMAVIQPTPAKKAEAKATPVKAAAVTTSAKPVPVKKAAPALPTPGAAGTHIAQLGSYGSESQAQAGWKVFQSRYANLKGQSPVITKANVDGKDYWRVAAGGFDAKGANAMCAAVKAGGHGCLPIAKSTAKADAKVRVAKAD
ncbi:SPOR domain-containing protein [Croceicoccus naphthovorans]|nr:SPOR domain-containing protein [Croceicoccus naphthovorans]MBB3990403.1 Flp pilus assembly protein TadD [Croceicoccus naphthovorans]